MSMKRRCATALAAVVALLATVAAQESPNDYPQWRGRTREGTASAFTEPKSWPDQLSRQWRVDVGEGYGTPIVVGSRVYTLTRRDENEVVTAVDADSGKVVWQAGYPAPHEIAGGASAHGHGPKSTPLFYQGKLYSLGITGTVSCFNASDGKLLWQRPAPAVKTLYNNSAMSPIADEGSVIVHVGGHDAGALTAFDANTGSVKWIWDGDGPSYGSPIVATLAGTRQVITLTQRYIVGIAADSGALLWQRPFANQFSNNSITPVLHGDTVIVSGYEKGVSAFKPVKRRGGWETETLWEVQEVSLFMSNPVLVGDTLFGLSQRASGQFFALDARNGRVLWLGPGREATNTGVTSAGNLLFFLNDDGELIVARNDPSRFVAVHRYTVSDSATWAQPAISGSRFFIKDASTLALWTVR